MHLILILSLLSEQMFGGVIIRELAAKAHPMVDNHWLWLTIITGLSCILADDHLLRLLLALFDRRRIDDIVGVAMVHSIRVVGSLSIEGFRTGPR